MENSATAENKLIPAAKEISQIFIYMPARNYIMAKKRLDKKGEGEVLSWEFFLKVILVISAAALLYFMMRWLGNAFLPK